MIMHSELDMTGQKQYKSHKGTILILTQKERGKPWKELSG
jgi:hypothetical protein